MPSATALVARSHPDHIIGIDNKLPWHLGTDLKHFRELTQNNAIIMGRKTYESIGRPLPKRLNIVLSRRPISDENGVKWAKDPETALLLADQFSIINMKEQFFVIGGETIYSLFDRFINVVYLTDVNTGRINGDAKFDRSFDSREWWYRFEREFPKSEKDDYSFRISCILRRKPVHRFIAKSDFSSDDPTVLGAWERYEAMMARSDPENLVEESQLDFLASL